MNSDLKETLLNLKSAVEYLTNISNELADNVSDGFEWVCIYCGYKIIAGANRELFKKRINMHMDLCITKVMLKISKGELI